MQIIIMKTPFKRQRNCLKVLAGEEKVSAVLHTYDPLHKQYWWEKVCYKTVSDADGRPIKAVVVGRDITEKVEAARRAEAVGVEMQNIINAIPGGVAIYRVADQFEAIYFSDGVPALTRHTAEEYKRLEPVSLRTVYPAGSGMVARKLRGACEQRAVADFDFRKQHRDGSIVWMGIDWRVPVENAILSEKDLHRACLKEDRKSTRLNSSHRSLSRMPSSA